jgi:osmoprotectant transport system substrate-binding protein
VQAADVNTTDGQLITGNYTLLKDPLHVFGYGNVVPVVTQKALEKEGPAFVDTINEVSSMLTNGAVQELNAAVDLSGQDPRAAARQFLASHGFTLVSTGQ